MFDPEGSLAWTMLLPMSSEQYAFISPAGEIYAVVNSREVGYGRTKLLHISQSGRELARVYPESQSWSRSETVLTGE